MNTELERRKQEITRSQGRRKLWQRIVSALAAVVMFVTTYVLILPVEAQNRTFCEMEAHEHSAENGCYVETKTLKCEEKHEHTDECYITLLTLICQHEEHIHNKECYADKTADIETKADWEKSVEAATLTGEWSKDILAIANTQLGYRESERNYILGENNEIKGYTRYGDWIGDKYTDWSAAFVAFCVNYSGISKDEMTYNKVPEQWMELMKSAKLFNENISETNPGDIVFIDENGDNKADRVGIVVEQSEDKIKTVEGDLNNAVAYFEYELSAQTARANVDSSVEESNSKDFAEAKSTSGRSGREASQTPNIIGSFSLPENPNYNPPITITDPENPDATSEPGNRVNPTSSPENRITPTTPPENRGITRASVPTLTNLDPATKVALIFDNGGNQRVHQFTTLTDAIKYIDTYSLAQECTIVFVQDYTVADNDRTELMKQTPATQINFTSTYNDGTNEIIRKVTYNTSGLNTYYSCDVVFHHISLSSSSHTFYARGYKLTFDEAVVTSGSLYIMGGGWRAAHPDTVNTGNPEITVLSGNWIAIYGGCYEAHMAADPTITIGGSAVVNSVYAGSNNYSIMGNATVNIKDQAVVTNIYAANGNVLSGSTITYNIDGSDGAKVNRVSGHQTHSNGVIQAGAELYINLKNIKDISELHADSTFGSGKLTVEGDCHVAWGAITSANIDAELLEDATLQLGSSSDLATAGNVDWYHGIIQFKKSLIMNANSKLIMAGDGANPNIYPRIIKDIDVRGANAEIDIYKRASTIYPISVTGEKLGSDELKLGIFKAQDVDTVEPNMTDILLTFSVEANAKEEDHLGGAVTKGSTYEKELDGVHKSGKNIIVCALLNGPIDIGIGRIVVGGLYDDSDPANPIYNTSQYNGWTDNLYAHDHALKPSYTLTGTNINSYPENKTYQAKVLVEELTTVELILDGITMRSQHNYCILVTNTDTTLTLKDGTTSHLYAAQPSGLRGGLIVKSGMSGIRGISEDAKLIIQCEHADEPGHRCSEASCGELIADARNFSGIHRPCIGSAHINLGDDNKGRGMGFSDFYVKGGIIRAYGSGHSPAIGTNCGIALYKFDYTNQWTSVARYISTPLSNQHPLHYSYGGQLEGGQYMKDVFISGGRIYAYGGDLCPGLGPGGGATKFENLYISNGAYVFAQGGYSSPGIGTIHHDWRVTPALLYDEYARQLGIQSFTNFIVSGGDTVVEAIGGETLPGQTRVGIGAGKDYLYTGYQGVLEAYADPDDGYVAIVKQGTPDLSNFNLNAARAQAEFVPGAPADSSLEIAPSQYYTLIYFAQISKTASVNGGAEAAGTFDTPVTVQEGDTIKYIIRTGEIADANGVVSGEVSDVIPEGLTYVPGSVSGNGSYDAATRTVKWTNQTFSSAHEFSFEVTVDQLAPGVLIKRYENQGALTHSDGTNTIPLNSNQTYHVVEKDPEIAPISFKKVLPNGTGLVGAGFSAFACTNTAAGHTHGDGCTWNASSPIETAALSDAQGRVYFNSLIVDNIYILTETTVPSGYLTPSDESYLVLNIAADKSYTITGYGDFAITGTVTHDGSVYSIKNIPDKYNFTLKKFVSGGAAGESFRFEVVIMNGSDILIWSDMSKLKVFDENGDPVANAASVSPAGVISFDLADGWRFEIEGVPTYYTVTVEEKNYDGYDVRIVGAAEAAAGKTEAIVMDDNKTVSYYNTRSVRDLTIEKTVQGSTTTEKFSFSVLIEDKNGQPVIIPEQYVGGADPHDPNYDPNNPGVKLFEVDQTTGEVTFEIANGESMLLPGIPVGSTVTVTETSHAGYTVQYNFSDGTPSVSGDTATVTITDDLTVTCINNAGFELPHTGGTGSLILTLGGVILVATALMYGISAKRRQWRAWI